MHNSVRWLEQEEQDVLAKDEKTKVIVLYNDDVNTFDHVIRSLVELCGQDLLQAEQCAFLVHYKGKCAVKNGSYKSLKPICEALQDRGLSATIES
jgi:ATP-dependent Clp protease adaptor protein ClpS